jgi:hypothetical protein
MSRILPILMIVLLVVLIAAGNPGSEFKDNTSTPDGIVQSFYGHVKADDYRKAFALIAPSSNVDFDTMYRDIAGRSGSLKTYSHLQKSDARIIARNGNQAIVRANLTWTTAVGALHETRDLKVVNDNNQWHIVWPKRQEPNLPPQVIPVNYLRWDVIHSDSEDNDWGAQNAEAPHVRIISMNPVEKDGNLIILGEVVNEDTVPAFVSVNGILLGKNGEQLAQESSFDHVSHILLPKEVSPFRIDFDHIKKEDVKSVTLDPTGILVPASADPVIGVLHQRIEKADTGHSLLKGELMNQSGELVNIPHVIATFYDNAGKVIWISDGYVDEALKPQIPIPFAVDLRDDVVANVKSYRVTVNHYTIDRPSI